MAKKKKQDVHQLLKGMNKACAAMQKIAPIKQKYLQLSDRFKTQ